MSDIFKFPNGYEVTVLRKEDVLKSIDNNIIDKEVALEIVRRCEIDAAIFLREGRWAGIPFMGSIRIPKTTQALISDNTRAILSEAQEVLDHDKFLLFRKSVAKDIGKQVKIERFYKYQLSKFVGKNYNFFRIIADKKGDIYARVLCYTLSDITTNDIANYE
ncbi:MAG: hypothetical protein J6Y28_09595 [Acholeplasmatales bacterium]|nr:hypothetical protein [Methanobrevibacter sp.]MBP5446411.1 hypothetical protein [Acholeplasmatales bacterium]